MNYKGINYSYRERQTYEGIRVGSFECTEFGEAPWCTSYFSATTEDEMHSIIDDMIDNIEQHQRIHELNNAAIADFYRSEGYKGD
jgi:hypothetical protein